jgi:hypothetical protein
VLTGRPTLVSDDREQPCPRVPQCSCPTALPSVFGPPRRRVCCMSTAGSRRQSRLRRSRTRRTPPEGRRST